MKINLATLTDSYKMTHAAQYPPKTETVFSYFESRTGATYPWTVFFGLQAIIKEYLTGVRITHDDVDAAKLLCDAHIAPELFNSRGWRHIVETHGGRLPLRIRAVAEGTVVPTGNVMMTVENTCPDCWWVTNWFETLLVQVWYPSTVATQSRAMKQTLAKFLTRTGGIEGIDFKLHDFGYRGVSSVETAGMGGCAHLTSFQGTDTVRGIEYAMAFYPAVDENGRPKMPGFSIPASEHSTITSWGEDGEEAAFRNMLRLYPTGLVACVSDSWDIFKACHLWSGKLKDAVLQRDGCLVVRPDSGDPIDVVPKVLNILAERFGYTTNDKGYKVLDPHVRLIQGDGIDAESLGQILEAVAKAGFSAENIAFGSGGGLLQKLNRDTQRFAFKCSAVRVDGEWRDVWKAPATDPAKNSKRGRLTLYRMADGSYETDLVDTFEKKGKGVDVMETVFEDGELLVDHTFDEVRARAELPAELVGV
jgi:nicotinamide phosphoribosyltransferase